MNGSKCFLIVFLLLLSTTNSLESSTRLSDDGNEPISNTTGRQGESGIDCSGMTFEDLLDYDFASLEFDIRDDWATSNVAITSFHNGSQSSIVRANLDGLFEGLPGGDNNYISTDEHDAFLAIGPECIAGMDSRIGLREGIPHRGSVDWNNLSYVEEGISIADTNMIPANHPSQRSCQNFGATTGCSEVPVDITNDLQIHLSLSEDESNNMRLDQLPNSGVSDFTLAFNVTNMTDADLVFNFPFIQGLRVYDYSLQNDGSEEMFIPEIIYQPDGSLTVKMNMKYANSDWPVIEHMFLDFTTAPPQNNPTPNWTVNAPLEGIVIPLMEDGAVTVTGELTDMWATDDGYWMLDCSFIENGWSVSLDSMKNLIVNVENSQAISSDAECHVVDSYGAVSLESRNWTFGYIFTSTAVFSSSGNAIEFTITPTGLVSEMEVSAYAFQNNSTGQISTAIFTSGATTIVLSLEGLPSGMVIVMGQIQGADIWAVDFMFDFGLEKRDLIPSASIDDFDAVSLAGGVISINWNVDGVMMSTDSINVTICETTDCTTPFETSLGTGNRGYIYSGDQTTHGVVYTVTVEICNEMGCNPTLGSGTVLADSQVDGGAMATDLTITESGTAWTVSWTASGDQSDVAAWRVCYDSETFTSTQTVLNSCVSVLGTSVVIDNSNFPVGTFTYYFAAMPFDELGNNAYVGAMNTIEYQRYNDTDSDGAKDNVDAFPLDPTETLDSDNDNVGDNADAFPNDANETLDSDNDNVGDNADAFPNDANETLDTDGDGVGDNGQLVAENLAAKQAADDEKAAQKTMMTILVIVVLLIGGAAGAVLFMRKRGSDDAIANEFIQQADLQPVALQPVQQTDPQPVAQQPMAVAEPNILQQWTDEAGHTWCSMDDGSNYWWTGTEWQKR